MRARLTPSDIISVGPGPEPPALPLGLGEPQGLLCTSSPKVCQWNLEPDVVQIGNLKNGQHLDVSQMVFWGLGRAERSQHHSLLSASEHRREEERKNSSPVRRK